MVGFDVRNNGVDYLVENTSEQMDAIELLNNSISEAAEAFNLARREKPFAATMSVQLAYDIAKDSLKHKRGDVERRMFLRRLAEWIRQRRARGWRTGGSTGSSITYSSVID